MFVVNLLPYHLAPAIAKVSDDARGGFRINDNRFASAHVAMLGGQTGFVGARFWGFHGI
jgi:hypothetical protein